MFPGGANPWLPAFRAALVGAAVVVWVVLCLTTYAEIAAPGVEVAAHHHGAGSTGDSIGGFAVWGALSMWMVMMVAMMVPVALPWARAFARIGSGRMALVFLSGYFATWLLFAAGATAVQGGLAASGLLAPSLILEDGPVRAALFLLVGAYQWSPLKESCLKHCESPATYFLSHWRDGAWGAVTMGARHGLYCVGCCWPLMVFMVGVGAMSVAWMAAFTLYSLAEMYVPGLHRLSRAAGGVLIVIGLTAL